MKKLFISILLIGMVLSLAACGKKKDNNKKDDNTESKEVINIQENSNSVVVYFSATGTTEKKAEKIANQSGSDIIEIIPKEEYTSADLNYNNDCRANKEQNDEKARPEIKNNMDLSKYDTIYLGYPIWWGTNPKIILTFLDSYDLTGKTIIPFCTSGSSGIEKSISDLRSYNSKLNIKDGKRFAANASDEDINNFVLENISEVKSSVIALIDGKEYKINLEDNNTAKFFANMLPKEFKMDELNGNEKYIYLDTKLPSNSVNPKRINAGDVMLYGDNCLVIFYKSFDTQYSYTKIGHIDNLPDLGKDSVTVKFYMGKE
ncbi:MAG: hypothetical protein IKH54_01530 [Bacilli bacterium]|nr:hypothetical protein [Bacilli bacterium]